MSEPHPLSFKLFRLWTGLALGLSLLALFLALLTHLLHLNQPYGGFFWAWDNTHGVYRVDELSILQAGDLQPADYLLAVEGEAGSPLERHRQAEKYYQQAQTVCTDPTAPAPLVSYTLSRRGTHLEGTAPIVCYRFATLLRNILIPLSLGIIYWSIALLVFRADSYRELNLVFALCAAWVTMVMASQVMDTPDIDTAAGQLVALTTGNLPYLFLAPSLLHLAAIFPSEYPSVWLKRTRGLWYFLLPAFLIAVGGLRFRLASQWSPAVQTLDHLAGRGAAVFFYTANAAFALRYWHFYRHAPSPHLKAQLRILISAMVFSVVTVAPFIMAREEPEFFTQIPLNQSTLLFGWFSAGIGIAYTILRYQVFRRRVLTFALLLALGLATLEGLIFATLPLATLETRFLGVILVLMGVNLFWLFPNNRTAQAIRRLISPGSIEKDTLTAFNQDIQGHFDLETLPHRLVHAFEKHLELRFAALWLENQAGLLTLTDFTENTPATTLPETLLPDLHGPRAPHALPPGPLAAAGCEIGLPLVVGETPLGFIALGARWTGEVFDETDLAPLAVMAQQAALALHTARQFRELRLLALEVERAQFQTRERIARDLHDSTQARLTQLLFALERVRAPLPTDPAQAEFLLDACLAEVQQTGSELRAILRDLLPQQLLGRTLAEALQEHAARAAHPFPTTRLSLDIHPTCETLLTPPAKETLLRVCQAAMDNALFHAQASYIRVIIQPSHPPDRVEFAIVDDGRGFVVRPTGEYLAQGHHGLYNMESRLLEQGGRLQIEATPGQGTVLKGFLPGKGL